MKKIVIAASLAATFIAIGASAEDKKIHYILCGNEPTVGLKDYISEFEASHPGFKIDLEIINWGSCQDKATNLAKAGTPPALAYMGARVLKEFKDADLIAPIPMSQEEADSYYPSILKAIKYKDEYLGVPVAASTRALYYNKDLFKAAGLDPEQPPQTWDELYNDAKAIKDKTGFAGYGLAGKAHDSSFHQFLTMLYSNGGQILDNGEIVFDSANNREVFDFYKKMIPVSQSDPVTWVKGEFINLFNDGKLATFHNGPWIRGKIKEGINWGVAPIPHGSMGTSSSLLIVDAISVFKGTGVEKEAIEFAKYITNPEHQFRYEKEYGLTPIRPVDGVAQLAKDDPTWVPFLDAMKTSGSEPLITDYRGMQNIIIDAIQGILLREITSDEAVELVNDGLIDLSS